MLLYYRLESIVYLREQDWLMKSLVLPTTVKQGVFSDDFSCHEQCVRCINSLSIKMYRHYSQTKQDTLSNLEVININEHFVLCTLDYNIIEIKGLNLSWSIDLSRAV